MVAFFLWSLISSNDVFSSKSKIWTASALSSWEIFVKLLGDWISDWEKQFCWIGSASAPKPLVSTSRVNSHLIRTLLGFTTRFLTFLSGYETRKCLQDNIVNCRLLERGSGFVWEIPRQHCTPKKYSQKIEVLNFSKCPGKLSNSFWARRTSVSKFAIFCFFWSKKTIVQG